MCGPSGIGGGLGQRILKETEIIEGHIHSHERWFGLAAVVDGEVHVADSILTSKVPFVVDAGNDDWGAWVQILGSDDTPTVAGNTIFDSHRLNFTTFETNNSVHGVQIAAGASGAAALSADNYNEFVVRTGAGTTFVVPIDLLDERHDVGTKLWIRNWCHGVNTSTLSFFLGLHEYIE